MTNGLVQTTARLYRASQSAYARKWSFLAVSVAVFGLSLSALAALGLTPDAQSAPIVTLASVVSAATTSQAALVPEMPTKIVISSIGTSAAIADPTSTAISVLDTLLLKGAVRYPTSARLGEDGNVVLFGHSSYLPIVKNPAYKTFNEIQKLKKGDTITVYSATRVYTYSVATVSKEDATSAGIPLQVTGRVLTLATCDSFGKKTDRFVVTAAFVESHPLGA